MNRRRGDGVEAFYSRMIAKMILGPRHALATFGDTEIRA